MSKVHKSNVPYLGSATLATLSGLEVTAATYTARVEADGGEIIDASAVSDAFAFCAAQGISPRNWILGASFGVRHVNGKVDKIYAFNGNDLMRNVPGSTSLEMWKLDQSGSFPVFKIETTSPGASPDIMKAQALQYLMNPGHTTWIAAGSGMNAVSGDGFSTHILSAYAPVGQGNAFSIDGYFNDSGLNRWRTITPNGTYDPTTAAAGTQRTWTAASPYVDYAGLAVFVNTTSREVTAYSNGSATVGPSNTDSAGFAWAAGFVHSSALFRFLMGGVVDIGGSTFRSNKAKIVEAWHVSGGTTAQALALSQRLDTLY